MAKLAHTGPWTSPPAHQQHLLCSGANIWTVLVGPRASTRSTLEVRTLQTCREKREIFPSTQRACAVLGRTPCTQTAETGHARHTGYTLFDLVDNHFSKHCPSLRPTPYLRCHSPAIISWVRIEPKLTPFTRKFYSYIVFGGFNIRNRLPRNFTVHTRFSRSIQKLPLSGP